MFLLLDLRDGFHPAGDIHAGADHIIGRAIRMEVTAMIGAEMMVLAIRMQATIEKRLVRKLLLHRLLNAAFKFRQVIRVNAIQYHITRLR